MMKEDEKKLNEEINASNTSGDNDSTVTMRGVSGKNITSKIKLFKINKKPKKSESNVKEQTSASVSGRSFVSETSEANGQALNNENVHVSETKAASENPALPKTESISDKIGVAASLEVAAGKSEREDSKVKKSSAVSGNVIAKADKKNISEPDKDSLSAAETDSGSDEAKKSVKQSAAESEAGEDTKVLPDSHRISKKNIELKKSKNADKTAVSNIENEKGIKQAEVSDNDISEPKAKKGSVSVSDKTKHEAGAKDTLLRPKMPRKLSSGKKLTENDSASAVTSSSDISETKAEKTAEKKPKKKEKVAAVADSDSRVSEKREIKNEPVSRGPRKLGNIYEMMGKKEGGKAPSKKLDKGLAATAAAFARRREISKNRSDDYGSSRQSFQRDKSQGTYSRSSRGPSTYRKSPGFAAPFDKDSDEDQKLQSRSRKPSKKKTISDIGEIIGGRQARGQSSAFQRQSGSRNDRNRSDGNKNNKFNGQQRRREQMIEEMEAEFRGRRLNRRPKKENKKKQVASVLTHVTLPSEMTVKEFAEAIKKTAAEVIKSLMAQGEMVTLNQIIDYDTASIIADSFGIETDELNEISAEDILFDDSEDKDEDLISRPPVVAVMGHVDHGKTSLLDYIRNAHVASGEAGGITQHIGAYMVNVNNRLITFLDTPGHEAFTTMRARGAKATDIAILVVAADDGVMPQTVEAINHARSADTKLVVAINKIDKAGANIEKVKQELASNGVVSEEWGGDVTMVPVSAKTGEGIDELLEMLLLTADMLELKANPDRQAKGIVIEAKLDKNRGALATLLVQRGTLHRGDTLVTGSIVGNVRAMTDASGKQLDEAGPSFPVEILGLPEVPSAGEIFYQVDDEHIANQLAEKRRGEEREASLGRSSRMSLDTLFSKMSEGEVKDLNIIVKADVQGSVEAVIQSLEKLSNDEVRINIVHSGVGGINESDIRLADVSNSIVIGFNVRPVSNAAELAEEAGVDIRMYRVIYKAIEDIEKAMKGLLDPEYEEKVSGHLEVREIFHVSNVGTIGGAYMKDGVIKRNSEVRLVRNGIVVYEGKLASLRRFKDDVKEVSQGYECGFSLENYNDLKIGDIVEGFEMVEVSRT